MKMLLGFSFLITIAFVTAAELPQSFKICHKSDPKFFRCLDNAVQQAIVALAPGLRSLKIVSIEPLAVDSISIGAAQGSVSLKQEYKNVKIHGLTKGLKISNHRIDWKKHIFYSDGYNPQVDFVANYKLHGKVLLLPITGAGKSNITMLDLKTKNTITCQQFEKDGEIYWKPIKYDIKFHPGRVKMQFDNLFNGDKVLGEQMNRFINENADLLFKELQGPYEESFGLVFRQLSENIFANIPISSIFPD